MRKLLLCVLAIVFLLPALMWGQNTGLISLQNDFSFGVFGNELDKAVNVGKGFTALSNNYLFGGLGNLNNLATIDAFTSLFADPVWVGYYSTGAMPWSLFGGAHHTSGPAAGTSATLYTNPNTETVVSGTTSTDYYWYAQISTSEYTVPAFRQINDSVQFLLDLGGLNIGAFLNVSLQNSTLPAQNFATTDTYQYNTSGVGVVPTPVTDYTRTTTQTDLTDGAGGPGIQNSLSLGIPVYLKSLNATANLRVGYSWMDVSTTYERIFTVPASSGTIPTFAAGTFRNTEQDDVLMTGGGVPISLDVEKAFAPLWGSHPDNAFKVGLDTWATFSSAKYSTIVITQDYTFVVAGAATRTARNWDTYDATYSGALDLGVGVNASHSFYFDPVANVSVGFVPRLDLVYRNQPAGQKTGDEVTVNRIDGDADGAFTSAADTIVTTTTTNYNQMVDSTGPIDESVGNVFEFDVALPSALKFQVLPWFGLAMGARPYVTGALTITKATGRTFEETVTTADGTGAVISTVVTNRQTGAVTTTNVMAWTVGVDHNLGVNIGIPGGIMLYVDVAGAVDSGVWDFKNLVIQGVIPLPAKGKK
jgi:hypothetical protein